MTQYGAGAESMAREMRCQIEDAEMILQIHQRIFHKFWAWQDRMLDRFTYDCKYQTSNGWSYKLPPGSTFRTWGETEGYSEIILPGERLYVKHPKDFELFKFFAEKAGFDV